LCPMLPVPLDCSFLLPLRCSLTCIYFYIPLHAIPVYVELFVFIVTFSICQLCHEYQMHRYSELTGEKPALEQTSENVNIWGEYRTRICVSDVSHVIRSHRS
jgi:hypothetical protein